MQLEEANQEREFERMDLRLKRWGVWSRRYAEDPELWDSDSPQHGFLSREEVADAWALQQQIVKLHITCRIVLQVHYVHRRMLGDIPEWQEVNKRLSKAAREREIAQTQISKVEYRGLLDGAIRRLLTADAKSAKVPVIG